MEVLEELHGQTYNKINSVKNTPQHHARDKPILKKILENSGC